MAAYAVRGWILASWLQGAYPFSSLLVDALALGVLLILFRALNAGVGAGLHRVIGKETRRQRILAGALQFGLVFVLAAPFFLTLSQLHPQRIVAAIAAGQVGVPCEEIWLAADGQRLSAWHLTQKDSRRPPVLILHGVGSNKQNFLPVGKLLVEFGHPVLLLDFRAHGNSDGLLTTLGYREIEDVKAAHDWLSRRYPDRPIQVVGYSLGAAAAVRAADTYGIFNSLVLDSCFARVENSIRHGASQWFLPPPLPAALWYSMRGWAWVFTGVDLDQLCPEENIARLADRRILLIHGTADATTSVNDSIRLQDRTQGRAELWRVEGAGHIQALGHPDYASRLQRFLNPNDVVGNTVLPANR